MSNFPISDDGVHSPEYFGFDMNNSIDVVEWDKITGEMQILSGTESPKILGKTSIKAYMYTDEDNAFLDSLGET